MPSQSHFSPTVALRTATAERKKKEKSRRSCDKTHRYTAGLTRGKKRKGPFSGDLSDRITKKIARELIPLFEG